jgi:Family of unknown function (DUF6152)
MRIFPALSTIAFVLTLTGAPTMAHHAAAMFDSKKSLTLHGTVKEFQWINPHCFIQLTVPDKNGAVEWSVEMASPSLIYRSGWRPGTVKAGEKVTLVIHPVRDGSHGGLYLSGTTDKGAVLGAQDKGASTP